MPSISQNQSRRQTRALEQWITESEARPDAAVKAREAALAHPCAPHVWRLDELWNGLADDLARLDRHDEAVEARARGAEAAGHDPAVTSCDHCGFVPSE